MSVPPSILVLGAGELGLPILTHLSALIPASTTLTVLLRPDSTPTLAKTTLLTHLKDLNIAILPGDVSNVSADELSTLFAPYHTLISCLGFSAGPSVQLKICRAALEAKVQRFFPWQFGVDYDVIGRGSAQDLFDEQLDVRSLLRAQTTTEWVIVSTGMFMSFLFEPWFGVVDLNDDEGKGVVRALGGWENEVTVTTPEDIGKVVSRIVFDGSVRDEVVFVGGQMVSYGALANMIEGVLGREAKREVWSVENLEEELKTDPGNAVKKYRVVFAEGKGVSWEMEKTYNAQKGIGMMDVKTWASANLRQPQRES